MAIKVFHAGQAGAPKLVGANGSLITVLDAVLVNGYNSVKVTGITRSDNTATVTTDTAHGLLTGDSVVIAGADQADYNVEAVVSVVDLTHFTYTVANSPDTPATGNTITATRASAGFDKVYSDTNKAVYRSRDPSGSRPYLQVIDDGTTAGGAREAKIRGYLTMSDVNTGTEPFPTPAQYANGLFAYKTATISNDARPWVLITDGKNIYFQACMDQSPATMQAMGGYFWWVAFGDIISTRANDPYTAFLAGCHAANCQTNTNAGWCHNGFSAPAVRTANPQSPSCYIVRSFNQTTGAVIMNQMGHGWDQNGLGQAAIFPYPNPIDNGFMMTPLLCMQGGVLRGRMPGVFEPLQGRCLNQFDIIENVEGYPGRKFMALWLYALNSNSSTGMLMFDITGDGNGKWS
jgi:hypothetical protein